MYYFRYMMYYRSPYALAKKLLTSEPIIVVLCMFDMGLGTVKCYGIHGFEVYGILGSSGYVLDGSF